MKTKSDEELMLEYANGKVEAFEELFSRYGQKIYNLFLRWSGNAALSQDLLQECFVKLTEARHRYQPRNAFSNWIFTIAMNLLRDRHREKQRKGMQVSYDTPGNETDRLITPEPGPHEALEDSEVKQAVENALHSLPDEQREVIILKKFHGFSFSEIGEILSISPDAAKQKAYRGMQTLRQKLSYLKEG